MRDCCDKGCWRARSLMHHGTRCTG
jgi:hypothetical protein